MVTYMSLIYTYMSAGFAMLIFCHFLKLFLYFNNEAVHSCIFGCLGCADQSRISVNKLQFCLGGKKGLYDAILLF